MPGSTPATTQLDWLISTTAMIVLSWSKVTRDLLKSLGWGIRALHQLGTATMVPSPRRLPHTISPLEGAGFELVWGFSCQAVVLWFCSEFFVRSGKGRSSSRRLRSGSRSARKGSRDRNANAAWRRAALASLVFRSALTPEHAEGR